MQTQPDQFKHTAFTYFQRQQFLADSSDACRVVHKQRYISTLVMLYWRSLSNQTVTQSQV